MIATNGFHSRLDLYTFALGSEGLTLKAVRKAFGGAHKHGKAQKRSQA
jgi:hypothetical protein